MGGLAARRRDDNESNVQGVIHDADRWDGGSSTPPPEEFPRVYLQGQTSQFPRLAWPMQQSLTALTVTLRHFPDAL
jgi:hypothetical protein